MVTVLIAVLIAILGSARPAAAERLVTLPVRAPRDGDFELQRQRWSCCSAASSAIRASCRCAAITTLAVTVIGPRHNIITFRKARVLGIWVNYESRVFENAPSYLAVLTNRPCKPSPAPTRFAACSSGSTKSPCRSTIDPVSPSDVPDETFRQAFLKLQEEHGLYRQAANGVTFSRPALFQPRSRCRPTCRPEPTKIEVKLFADGLMIARTPSALEIYKAGFEQFVTPRARKVTGVSYGLATIHDGDPDGLVRVGGVPPGLIGPRAWEVGSARHRRVLQSAGSGAPRSHRAAARPACAR